MSFTKFKAKDYHTHKFCLLYKTNQISIFPDVCGFECQYCIEPLINKHRDPKLIRKFDSKIWFLTGSFFNFYDFLFEICENTKFYVLPTLMTVDFKELSQILHKKNRTIYYKNASVPHSYNFEIGPLICLKSYKLNGKNFKFVRFCIWQL